MALTNAAGTLVERYTYSAYGTLGIYDPAGTVRSSSPYANRYTYTGREWDADLRIYHFRARWYDPATGGFVSRDPLGYVDGMSLYRGYFGLRNIDPSGNATREQVETGKLQYSCNCGWIDWTHAGEQASIPSDDEFMVIWQKLNAQTKAEKKYFCFKMTQRKDGFSTGFIQCFWVRSGLNQAETRCAAWAIFRLVSDGFEEHQGTFRDPRTPNSSFSPEDLTSNLIRFMRTIDNLSRAEIASKCIVIDDVEENLRLFDLFPWDVENRNYDNPIVFKACTPCGGHVPRFPEELNTPCSSIDPSKFGLLDGGATFHGTPFFGDLLDLIPTIPLPIGPIWVW